MLRILDLEARYTVAEIMVGFLDSEEMIVFHRSKLSAYAQQKAFDCLLGTFGG